MTEEPQERLAIVQERLAKAAARAGRKASDITLVAVTKTVPWERLLPWAIAGQTQFGENKVQEALGKFLDTDQRKKVAGTFHLIGPLQSNKAKKAVHFFDLIQSLDRLDLAKDLNRHADEAGKKIACLIEVKISPETSKSGLDPERLPEFLDQLGQFPHIEVKGLMGIPPFGAAGDKARPYFARLRMLFEKTKLSILSMGMSSDFETAIEEGATMIRLGTVLFGTRA